MRVPININVPRMKAGGEFRLMTYEPYRNDDIGLIVADDTDWFDNLVLNSGLINMTTQSQWPSNFHIGGSSVPPAITQTALIDWLAFSATGPSDVIVNLGAPNYQGQMTRGRRFNAGNPAGTETIRELGLGQDGANVNLSVRTLVTPEIIKSDVQILDTFYRFTTWPNLADGTGIVNIFGDDYDYTVRMGTVQELFNVLASYRPDPESSRHTAYDGDIGSVTEIPSGSASNSSSVTITGQGSGFCNYTIGFGIDNGNFAGGLRSIASRLNLGGSAAQAPRIQVEFRNRGEGTGALDSTIPKNGTREINFDLGITWDRH